MRTAVAALLGVALALPSSVWAQDAGPQDVAADWDILRDPGQKTVLAYTVFDVGLGISFRCTDGGFDAVIGGLPPAGAAETRPLTLIFADPERPPHPQIWNVAVEDTMAVSPLPAPLARRLREGGRLQIVVPGAGGEGRNLRYDLTLPVSSAAIDEALTACGWPLVDPRDAALGDLKDDGLPSGLLWARRPRPEYPMGNRVYRRGFAVATCVTAPDGRLRDCVIETEHPRDGGFGASVLSAARRARVERADGSDEPLPPARLMFRTNFIMN
ncbi:hypothetical protein [Brevundimonas sp.]|uniref:hypothetical protein n=1 Tax=Brevundimonas sp. TaxID=1871086 RepID=UPI0026273ACF|nr:hypothetical protein [Brevundimonas sp.]